MLGTEEHAASKREALRAIFSKVFLAKVMPCALATTSLITTALNFGFVQWNNSRSYHYFDNHDYMRRIEDAYERLTNDDARMEWVELLGPVSSAAFVKSYYLAFFGA
jgi:hypothetical protein